MKPRLKGLLAALAALICLVVGGGLASQHPLWPVAGLCLFYIGVAVAVWRPMSWLFLAPAGLPFLNFAPWSGWLAVDEFDLLLLALFAGSYFRLAKSCFASRWCTTQKWPGINLLLGAWLLSGLVSAIWGFQLAAGSGAFSFDLTTGLAPLLTQAYAEPMNSLRVFKSLLFSGSAVPLLAVALRDGATRAQAGAHLVRGMLVGAAGVSLVVLWERMAFPGLLDFSTQYRTTAMFWEMHVGGGAIDVYLVLAVPFVAYALANAQRPSQWLCAATLSLLLCHAVLTSFSRSLYIATVLPLLLLWGAKRLRASAAFRWRGKAGMVLAGLLALEAAAVITGGTFLRDRMYGIEADLASRVAHWQRGLALLDSPQAWALGVGLGRLPARYAQASTGQDTGEFSGSIVPHWRDAGANSPHEGIKVTANGQISSLTLKGPVSDPDIGVLFGLTQAVSWQARERYTISMRFRIERETHFLLKVCEKHLIYEANCHARKFRLRPTAGLETQEWQALSVTLQPDLPFLPDSRLYTSGVLSVAVVGAGDQVQLREIRLYNAAHRELTQNGDFSKGMTYWFPAAGGYYLPWHIDNLFLELLIERGLVGLVLFVSLLVAALRSLGGQDAAGSAWVPTVVAAWGGALLVGSLSSVMDVPRVAFLFLLLLMVSIQMGKTLVANRGIVPKNMG